MHTIHYWLYFKFKKFLIFYFKHMHVCFCFPLFIIQYTELCSTSWIVFSQLHLLWFYITNEPQQSSLGSDLRSPFFCKQVCLVCTRVLMSFNTTPNIPDYWGKLSFFHVKRTKQYDLSVHAITIWWCEQPPILAPEIPFFFFIFFFSIFKNRIFIPSHHWM